MRQLNSRRRGGFSLLELVVVITILGILAAIAIPRLSRGAAGAADSALASDLAVMRNAIDMYSTEHGGDFPDADDIEDQLTKYTDASGDVSEDRDSTHIYGPYLRKVPPLPVGAKKGNKVISTANGDEVGWIYDEDDGEITANCTNDETDVTGKKYNEY